LLEIEQLTQRDRLDLIELELAERPPRMRLWIERRKDSVLSANRSAPRLSSDLNPKHRVAHRPKLMASASCRWAR
jgi:hypothetical protein